MDRGSRSVKRGRGEWQPLIKGLSTALVAALVLLTIFSLLMTKQDLSDTVITVIAVVILAIASALGGWIASKSAGVRGLKVGAVIGAILFAVVTVVSVAIHGLAFTLLTLIKAGACIICGMLGGILGVNAKAKHKMK